MRSVAHGRKRLIGLYGVFRTSGQNATYFPLQSDTRLWGVLTVRYTESIAWKKLGMFWPRLESPGIYKHILFINSL